LLFYGLQCASPTIRVTPRVTAQKPAYAFSRQRVSTCQGSHETAPTVTAGRRSPPNKAALAVIQHSRVSISPSVSTETLRSCLSSWVTSRETSGLGGVSA
jgi:hypothetical protein